MRQRFFCLTVLLVTAAAVVFSSPVAARQSRLVVFAGAASKPALDRLAHSYEQKYGTKVEVTYGGSGSVLTQFAQEQYGDVYVPGSDDFMDKAVAKGAVAKKTRTVLVYLVPVLSVAKGNSKKITGLRDMARRDLRVVVGEPKSVCLGAIAQEVLTKTGLWTKVQPRIATYGTSCEDVLNHLLLGEADVILGWDCFARQHPREVQSVALPVGLTKARNVPAAMITWSRQPEKACSFIRFLAAPANRPVWQACGYAVTAPCKPSKH